MREGVGDGGDLVVVEIEVLQVGELREGVGDGGDLVAAEREGL